MKTTTTYNLNKPESTDFVDIEVLNENMDKIETQFSNLLSDTDIDSIITESYTEPEKKQYLGGAGLGKFLVKIKDIFIAKTSIVHNAEVTDTTKVPGMDLIHNMQEQITTQDKKLKLITYVDLYNMGLSTSSLVNTAADVATVVSAMSDKSMFVYTFSGGQFGLPPTEYGVIEIKRHSIDRVSLIAVNSSGKTLYYGAYHGTSGFSGWYAVTGTLLS